VHVLTHAAIRGRRPLPPLPLPPARVGHSHPRHPRYSRLHRGWKLPLRRHDQEQPEEGPESQAEEGIINLCLLRYGNWKRGCVRAYGRRMGTSAVGQRMC
jgi:hypothetical protein